MAIEVKEFKSPYDETYEVEGYVLRCTTTGLLFGPTLSAEAGADDAEAFLGWFTETHGDPRCVPPGELADAYNGEWPAARENETRSLAPDNTAVIIRGK